MNLQDAGVVWTFPNHCGPLDDVRVVFEWTGLHGQEVCFRFIDAAHQEYHRETLTAGEGRCELTVKPGQTPGVHMVSLDTTTPDGQPYPRHGSFRVTAQTGVTTDTGEMDELLEMLGEGLRQIIDVTIVNGKRRVYYKAADNTRQNLAYPAFGIDGLRYFLDDLQSMFEAIYDNQWPDGRLPDHVYGDNYHCARTPRKLRTCMADLEIGCASTLMKGWQAHGDDAWLREMMPKIEAGIDYVTTDPLMFSEEYGVIKRPHTLDEWDIAFDEEREYAMASDSPKWVVMQGDTAQLYHACDLLSQGLASIGDVLRSKHYAMLASHYYHHGNALFWDGVKYRPHIHLHEFDHGDFDEADQLTMSNAAAITRGFADHAQAVSIIDEHVRRWKETGDRFPWWSLQPGYPESASPFRQNSGAWTKGQGEYCNGGLFPWVGGELCRAALMHGREELAVQLLRDLLYAMKRDNGGLFTWYHLDGSAAINAPHSQTNYDPWGLGPWAAAIVEELAGIKSDGKLFQHVLCAPRWPVSGTKQARAVAHFPSSDAYFAYEYTLSDDRIAMHFTGTGCEVCFRILLPDWDGCSGVTVDGEPVDFEIETVEASTYVTLRTHIKGARELVVLR